MTHRSLDDLRQLAASISDIYERHAAVEQDTDRHMNAFMVDVGQHVFNVLCDEAQRAGLSLTYNVPDHLASPKHGCPKPMLNGTFQIPPTENPVTKRARLLASEARSRPWSPAEVAAGLAGLEVYERTKHRLDVKDVAYSAVLGQLKHGPAGLGGPGPCDDNCLKCAKTDPMDVKHDGVSLRELLRLDEQRRREDVHSLADRVSREFGFTAAQRAAVSAHWSAQLRAKVAAKRERDRLKVDLQDE